MVVWGVQLSMRSRFSKELAKLEQLLLRKSKKFGGQKLQKSLSKKVSPKVSIAILFVDFLTNFYIF